MIFILDHQDSFTYNIYALLKKIGVESRVYSTEQTKISELKKKNITGLILSPGPGVPKDARLFYEAIEEFKNQIPILGICLGHQAIAEYFGGTVSPSSNILHGKIVTVTHTGDALFEGMPNEFLAMRYNSLSVKNSLPDQLTPVAWSNGEIMALKHTEYAIAGLQFHPESVGTIDGQKILINFFKRPKV